MKEIDFLPEWYKEGKRRRLYMRRQCIALGGIFLAMMTYNLMAAHRTAKATAELARFEDERVKAESIQHEFDTITKELSDLQTKVDLVERIDSKIDMAAVLAELSHVIGETIILSRVEFIAEPLMGREQGRSTSGSGVRAAGNAGTLPKGTPLTDVRFRVLLAGQAASPAEVATLVCRLDDSWYFRQVYPSFSRPSKVQMPAKATRTRLESKTNGMATQKETIEASEFEIVCYLANYEEIDSL